jgi:hypothetical protein
MDTSHLSDGHLERYVIGLVHDEAELKWVEDHLYACPECAERMWAMNESLDDPETGSVETITPDLYRQDHPLQ